MAEKAKIYKGIKQVVTVQGLEPGTPYYAMLVHVESGEFICTPEVTPDAQGIALFTFTYTQTNNIEAGKVTLQVFDAARNFMVVYLKNIGTVIETYLKDDLDVEDYQAEEKEIPDSGDEQPAEQQEEVETI